jgi:hypothetical protein
MLPLAFSPFIVATITELRENVFKKREERTEWETRIKRKGNTKILLLLPELKERNSCSCDRKEYADRQCMLLCSLLSHPQPAACSPFTRMPSQRPGSGSGSHIYLFINGQSVSVEPEFSHSAGPQHQQQQQQRQMHFHLHSKPVIDSPCHCLPRSASPRNLPLHAINALISRREEEKQNEVEVKQSRIKGSSNSNNRLSRT